MLTRDDYEAKTVPQLRTELVGRGLDDTGNKPDLIDRLIEADRADLESKTVPEIQDELRDAELPVSGTKDELVDRLTGEDEPPPDRAREQRTIEAGGHTLVVDVDPPTPPEVAECSICGGEDCVHLRPDAGTTWRTSEAPVAAAPPATDGTFWPDETVGARSVYNEDTPDPDLKAAEEIGEAIEEEKD